MIEEESSERMFRIILLSNQKKNKSVSCFSCLQTYYTRSEENRAEYERACARTEQGLESQPFDYEKIGSERYARTWNVKNSYENYSGQRDQVLLSESSRRIAEYDFSVPDLTVDNKDENGCPWKRAAGSYGCGLCGSFCLQGNGGSGS